MGRRPAERKRRRSTKERGGEEFWIETPGSALARSRPPRNPLPLPIPLTLHGLDFPALAVPVLTPLPEPPMHYIYPKTVRVYRPSRGLQIAFDLAVAVSSALFFSYLILHGVI